MEMVFAYCHRTASDDVIDEEFEFDCLDYMECEECPYYYQDDCFC